MFIFGHAGITLGVATLLSGALIKSQTLSKTKAIEGQRQPRQRLLNSQNGSSGGIASWLDSLASRIDIRLLLIGSLLPDIIDKPIGWFLLRDTFGSGRIFCHTLLFLIVMTLGGLALYWRRKSTSLLALSFGVFTHLILDLMWQSPKTFLWPLYGWEFERRCLSSWIQGIIRTIIDKPIVGIFELAGAIVVIWFIWLIVRRKKFRTFIRNGQI
jgi:inner membrane protein